MTGDGPLILVVEDDPALRLLYRVNLELDGFRIGEAASVAAARQQATAERPAVVFLDALLGAERCDELLDELRGAGIPVVVVSGVDCLDAYRDRASEVLAKPFDPQVLSAVAARLAVGRVSAP